MDKHLPFVVIVRSQRIATDSQAVAEQLEEFGDVPAVVVNADDELLTVEPAAEVARRTRAGENLEREIVIVRSGGAEPVARAYRRPDEDRIEIEGLEDVGVPLAGALRSIAHIYGPILPNPGRIVDPGASNGDRPYKCDLNEHQVWMPEGSAGRRCPVNLATGRCEGSLQGT